VVRRHRLPSQDSLGSTSGATVQRGQDSEIQGSTIASALAKRFNRAENLQVSTSAQTYQNIAAPFGPSIDGNWDADFSEVNTLGLENILVANQDINSMPSAPSKVSDALVTGTSSASWTRQLSSTSLFSTRPFIREGQVPLVSLAMRILRSYPFMILRKGILPPFMSPVVYSWAETGKGPPQQVSFSSLSLIYASSGANGVRSSSGGMWYDLICRVTDLGGLLKIGFY